MQGVFGATAESDILVDPVGEVGVATRHGPPLRRRVPGVDQERIPVLLETTNSVWLYVLSIQAVAFSVEVLRGRPGSTGFDQIFLGRQVARNSPLRRC